MSVMVDRTAPHTTDWAQQLRAQGRSLTWLAAELGVTRTYLSDIAAGRKRPSPELESRIRAITDPDADLRLGRVREWAAERARWHRIQELAAELDAALRDAMKR